MGRMLRKQFDYRQAVDNTTRALYFFFSFIVPLQILKSEENRAKLFDNASRSHCGTPACYWNAATINHTPLGSINHVISGHGRHHVEQASATIAAGWEVCDPVSSLVALGKPAVAVHHFGSPCKVAPAEYPVWHAHVHSRMPCVNVGVLSPRSQGAAQKHADQPRDHSR